MIVPLELYPPLVAKISSILPFSYSAYHASKLALIFSYETFFKVVVQLLWILFFIGVLFIFIDT